MDSSKSNTSRELSAIFFADIVGYTSMMEQDEQMALSLLNRYQKVLKENLNEYHGSLIKNYGDGSLCLFNSVLNAVKCAESIQLEFKRDLQIPLRIGLHLGDVTHIKGDVYSNDINIASRIESLGVAGSVLTSSEFYNKIKNQKGLEFKSLGKYLFKNVKKEMEIMALANEGMTIPRKEQISGKIEPKGSKVPIKWIVGTVFLILAGVIGYINLGRSVSPLSEEVKEKRIAVLNFQNQTMDPDMGVYGSMISDWITRGLMETGAANIINAANIREEIANANLGQAPNPAFSSATGVDIILEGRYYLAEANLFIVANFIDVNSGKILHFVQLDAARDDYMQLLKEITDELMSYWIVKDDVQFSLSPPNYEAYKEWDEGEKLYTTNALEAITRYENAFLKDTSFYPPLFRLFSLYTNTGNTIKAEEIIDFLYERQSSFTKYEKLDFDQKRHLLENNYVQGAKASEEKYKMDPSDYKANYNAAYLYNLSRNYDKAIESLNDFDPRYVKDVGLQKEWRLSAEAHAYYQKGDYGRVHELAEENPDARYFTPYVVHHLMSLVRMDSLHSLDVAYDKYTRDGIYEPTGQATPHNQLLIVICIELYLADKTEYLNKYIRKLEEWLSNNEVPDFLHTRPDIFNNLPFREQEIQGYVSFFKNDYKNAIKHWEREAIPDSNWPDQMERASRLGVCYALIRDEAKANEEIQVIHGLLIDDRNASYTREYYKARIYSALGNKSQSLKLIKKAIENGFMFFRPFVMERDPFLKAIIKQPELFEFIKPI